jgi:DNA-binding SARP family transcriptional activator
VFRALALAADGRSSEALPLLDELSARSDIDGEGLHAIARAYALLEDTEKAHDFCNRALQAHAGPTEAELSIDPHLAIILTDLVSASPALRNHQ